MITILSKQIVKARKLHRCNYCDDLIIKGQKYERSGLIFDDHPYTWKSHLYCNEIANKLRMFDECDEGLTQDDFYECIQGEYCNVVKEEEDCKRTFLEMLKFVCDYYKINLL